MASKDVICIGEDSFLGSFMKHGSFADRVGSVNLRAFEGRMQNLFADFEGQDRLVVVWLIKDRDDVSEYTLLVSLLDRLRSLDVKNLKFIYVSSFAVYGRYKSSIDSGERLQKMVSNYGLQKLRCEQLVKDYYDTTDATSIQIIRLPSFYDTEYPDAGICPWIQRFTTSFSEFDPRIYAPYFDQRLFLNFMDETLSEVDCGRQIVVTHLEKRLFFCQLEMRSGVPMKFKTWHVFLIRILALLRVESCRKLLDILKIANLPNEDESAIS